MSCYIPVHGTWGWPAKIGDWWLEGSALRQYLQTWGLCPLRADEPFWWSGDVNGGLRWPWSNRGHTDWAAAGQALNWYLRTHGTDYVPIADRRLITHSHGLQVVLYACAKGLKIDRLVSVTGPIRGDMAATAQAARPNIGRWVHVHADADRTQVFGAMLDGVWGIHRAAEWRHQDGSFTRADENVQIPGIGHSGLLRDPTHFHWWTEAALVPFLTEA